jgi:hypothetical protein
MTSRNSNGKKNIIADCFDDNVTKSLTDEELGRYREAAEQ